MSSTGGTVNSFLYQGQQWDGASQTYYLRARYYNQNTGRFLSQDPFEGNALDAASLHRYLYANNDPVNRFDPSGRYSLSETIVASAILTGFLGLTNHFNDGYVKSEVSASQASRYEFPDITSELENVIGALNTAWNNPAYAKYHNQATASLTNFSAGGAWDIDGLTNRNGKTPSTGGDAWIAASTIPSLSSDDINQRMVRVDGKTFHSYTINYVIFGRMIALSGYNRFQVSNLTDMWKATAAGLDRVGAEEWALAGYDNWPYGGSTPDSDISSIGESGLQVPRFNIHWEGFGPNNSIFFDGTDGE